MKEVKEFFKSDMVKEMINKMSRDPSSAVTHRVNVNGGEHIVSNNN